MSIYIKDSRMNQWNLEYGLKRSNEIWIGDTFEREEVKITKQRLSLIRCEFTSIFVRILLNFMRITRYSVNRKRILHRGLFYPCLIKHAQWRRSLIGVIFTYNNTSNKQRHKGVSQQRSISIFKPLFHFARAFYLYISMVVSCRISNFLHDRYFRIWHTKHRRESLPCIWPCSSVTRRKNLRMVGITEHTTRHPVRCQLHFYRFGRLSWIV